MQSVNIAMIDLFVNTEPLWLWWQFACSISLVVAKFVDHVATYTVCVSAFLTGYSCTCKLSHTHDKIMQWGAVQRYKIIMIMRDQPMGSIYTVIHWVHRWNNSLHVFCSCYIPIQHVKKHKIYLWVCMKGRWSLYKVVFSHALTCTCCLRK